MRVALERTITLAFVQAQPRSARSAEIGSNLGSNNDKRNVTKIIMNDSADKMLVG